MVCECETGSAAHADDGIGSDVPEAEIQPGASGASHLPLSAAGCDDCAAPSGVRV